MTDNLTIAWLGVKCCKAEEQEEKTISANVLTEGKETEDVEAENNMFAANERLQQHTVVSSEHPTSSLGHFYIFAA